MPDLSPYCGRFAPSPSGPLHAGSLVAALGSYLDARAHNGRWLVRMEDIDPPREMSGAADIILRQLEAHGLYWDGNVRYQSNQSDLYQAALSALDKANLIYACDCSRKQIKLRTGYYTGVCRHRALSHNKNALRFFNHRPVQQFHDRLHGHVDIDPAFAAEDFILRRRDGLWAYQLAVVCDDRNQGITHIVRGSDLLQPSAWQLSLWQALNTLEQNSIARPVPLPDMAHLPLITDNSGRKLSKQNHAPALDSRHPEQNIHQALDALGIKLSADHNDAPLTELLQAAIPEWHHRYSR